jgi:glycosyltransferase involved in cell wall biosynthesis
LGRADTRTSAGPSPVGLVHDFLLTLRGAERTFATMAELWPKAPIYTTVYSAPGTGDHFAEREVHASYLQRLRPRQESFRRLLPLYPRTVERLRLGPHPLLISSSSAFAHGITPAPGAVHVCYCHTPFRYAWFERDRARKEVRSALRPLLERSLDRIRRWDLEASRRVTHYIANSQLTRERIGDLYGRDAAVVHPPVAVDRFRPGAPEDFVLIVSALVPHKRIDVALEAVRLAGARARVVGEGPELARLQAEFDDVAEFHGWTADSELADLYSRCRALVVPAAEEFGIAAVEAQAAGRPVVALASGGALETVVDGETGVLVPGGAASDFAEAIRETDFERFDPGAAVRNASRFSVERFQSRLRREVERVAREPARECSAPPHGASNGRPRRRHTCPTPSRIPIAPSHSRFNSR